jgi:hypothetical protein
VEQCQDRRLDDDDLFLNARHAGEMATASPSDRWQIDGAESIDLREWGEEFVIRVAKRAETHLLSATAGAVLLALLDGQMLTLEALYAKAFQDFDSNGASRQAMSPSEHDSLRAIVDDFERLGIVTRIS